MKNLSKALALLVVVAMTLTSVAFAATNFSDVAGDAANAQAINVGAALGLFKGYDDGTFKPEGSITRAEFAAIVVRLVGQESAAAGATTATSFNDVPADNWAAGYINIATRLGIINGYGDGNFGPDDQVLYEQAVKMIVVALGYEPLVGTAGYPVGYLTEAASIGLTDGVNGENGVAANRGLVAQLIYNALDTPLLKQTGYGAFLNYEVQDGNGDTEKETVLSEYLGIVKISAMVDSSSAMDRATTKDETVKVTVKNNYKSKYGQEDSDIFQINDTPTLAVGKSGIADLVGTKAIIYIAYDENSNDDPEVLYATKDVSPSDEITITSKQLENVSYDDSDNYVLVNYREKPEDRSVQSYKLDFDTTTDPESLTKVYLNGVLQSNSEGYDIVKAIGKKGDFYGKDADNKDLYLGQDAFYGDMVLSNNDAEFDYNTVFVTDYQTVVVDEVSKTKVTGYNDTDVVFSKSDNTVKATLYDASGKEMNWTDLKEYDVVTFTETKNTSTTVVNGWLVDSAITGTVKSKSKSGDDDIFDIDGTEYKCASSMDPNEIGVGDSGKFFLDKLGNVVYVDTTDTINDNYAYVIDAIAYDDGFDNVVQLKLFKKDGTVGTYNVADKVKIDGITVDSEDMIDATVENDPKLVDTIPAPGSVNSLSVMNSQGKDTVNLNWDGNTITSINNIDKGELITYNENSSNDITTIDRPFGISNTDNAKGKFTQYKNEVNSTFSDGTDKTLSQGTSKLLLTDKTVIMLAPAGATDDDKYELVDVSSFTDDDIINNVTFYNVNADKEIGAVVISDPDFSATGSSNTFVIADAVPGNTINTEGDTVSEISGLRNGAALENDLITTSDANVDVNVGDVFIPLLNGKGEVKSINLLATANDTTDTVDVTSIVTNANAKDDSKAYYYYGDVTDISRKNITVNDALTIGGNTTTDFSLTGANIYLYDERQSESRRVIGPDDFDLSDLHVNSDGTFTDDSDSRTITNIAVFAREYGGDMIDAVIYIFD